MFLGANAEKGEVILRVNVSNSAPGLHCELAKESCILNCGGII